MAKVDKVDFTFKEPDTEKISFIKIEEDGCLIYIPSEGHINPKKEIEFLEKKLPSLKKKRDKLDKMLKNPQFREKAKIEVFHKSEQEFITVGTEVEEIERRLNKLKEQKNDL